MSNTNVEKQKSAHHERLRKISVSSAKAVLAKLNNASMNENRRASLVIRTNSNTSLISAVKLKLDERLKLSADVDELEESSSEQGSKRCRRKKPLGLSLLINKVTPSCSSSSVLAIDSKLDQCIERVRQSGRMSLTLMISSYSLTQKKKLKHLFGVREMLASKLEHRKIQVLKELGSGAFGSVHKVKDLETGILIARKNLYWQENTSNRSDVEQRNKGILNELRILGESVSPFVVGFYDAYKTEGNVLSIFIEYMDIGSIYDVMLKLNRIPEVVLASVAQSVLKAMNYLVTKFNMIHRDIKPQNILLNSRGEIKLSDFGISIELSDSSLTDSSSGSILYMAPEILTNQASNTQSEIWSLGLSLAHLASGTYPLPKLPSDYFADLFKVDPNGYSIRSMSNNDINASFPFELISDISNDLPVNLPEEFFSTHFISFVTVCLQKSPSDRSSYKHLLKHDLIKKSVDKDRLKEWLSNCTSIISTI